MATLQDHYKTLQVHPQAEQEVIEAAYKRLAKKYHPDLAGENLQEATFTMQVLNEAYAVLKDETTRKAYHSEWEEKYAKVNHSDYSKANIPTHLQQTIYLANGILSRYFESIKQAQYKEAYQLLSREDQSKITPEVFAQWQQAVRRIFALQNFTIQASTTEIATKVHFKPGHLLRFVVLTVEYNSLMDRLEQDAFERQMVREKDRWAVVIGDIDISGAIKRFDALAELMAAKNTVKAYVDTYSKHDAVDGVYNKKGILECIEKEGLRYNRYGRRFSLLMLGVTTSKKNSPITMRMLSDHLAQALVRYCRELDCIGRWSEQVFVVLMPETDLKGALLAAQKLRKHFKRLMANTEHEKYITFPCAVDTYPGSLAMAIDRLDFLYNASLAHKTAAIYSLRGPLT